MGFGISTSSCRLHQSCRVKMVFACAAVFAIAFFLGRAPAGIFAPSSPVDSRCSGKGA